ncbi:MAG: NAD(+) synthase [Chlamydiota bacterium]
MKDSAKGAQWLQIDAASTAQKIISNVQDLVGKLQRKGLVVGLSGGIDSSVVAALCVQALGKERVLGLIMPERECSDDSLRLGRILGEFFGIQIAVEDITAILEAAGCYSRRDKAIRELVPDFGPAHRCKLVMADLARGARYALPSLIVEPPDAVPHKVRLNASVYLAIVAASNFKQRVRAMLEYYYADRLQYAVAGTPNRLEFDQGFFVKNGDGAADLKPIAHLYKSQVYQLADYFGLPAEIRERPSTTDTFSLPQSQEEFYFSVPLRVFDLCLYGKNQGLTPEEVSANTGLKVEQVAAVFEAIEAKRRATAYLHQPPLLVEAVGEIAHCLAQ